MLPTQRRMQQCQLEEASLPFAETVHDGLTQHLLGQFPGRGCLNLSCHQTCLP
jgi:hypothetical protein